MYQTRQKASKLLPIQRKGTKYVAKALHSPKASVPVVIAVRDMLQLARNAKEVKKMIIQKALKINGRNVKDYRDPICLLNIFEADKPYVLTLLPTKKFVFEETKSKDRMCKIIGKKLIGKNQIQLNLHDGTNILAKESAIPVGDTIIVQENKLKSHISFSKGKEVLVFKGKYTGQKGKIIDLDDHGILDIKFKEKSAKLNKSTVIVL